jgi:hypothetical protein
MATFEELYGAWSAADETARAAEADLIAAFKTHPVVPEHLQDRATSTREAANGLLHEAMKKMRDDAPGRRQRRWPFVFA